MSEQVNSAISFVEKLIHDVLWAPTKELALEALFNAAPWLRFPLLKLLITYLVNKYPEKFFDWVKRVIDIWLIKKLDATRREEFKKQVNNLNQVLSEKGPESEEYRKAREEAKLAMSRATRINQ